LLHHLQRCAENNTTERRAGLPDGSAEAVGPGLEIVALGDQGHLVLVVCDDLGKLILDVGRVDGLIAGAGKSNSSLVKLALLDEVARGLRQEEQPDRQDEGPSHLQTDRDTVRAAISAVLGAVVDARSEKQPKADTELVSRDDGTADLAGRDLGHVQDDDSRDETNAKSSNKSARHNQAERGRSRLEDDSDDEDHASKNNRCPTPEPIRQIASNQSTEKGTGRENRRDQRLVGRGKRRSAGPFDGVDEVLHAHDAGDVSRVVAEEDTAKCSENAHQVSLDRDGGLDTSDIVGATRWGGCTTRHLAD